MFNYLPGVINALQIGLFNLFYQQVVFRLNPGENHKHFSSNENSLVFKLFLFIFFNTFNSFFLITYASSLYPSLNLCLSPATCFDTLGSQTSTIFTAFFLNQFPQILFHFLKIKLSAFRSKPVQVSQVHGFIAIDTEIEAQHKGLLPFTSNGKSIEIDGTMSLYLKTAT